MQILGPSVLQAKVKKRAQKYPKYGADGRGQARSDWFDGGYP